MVERVVNEDINRKFVEMPEFNKNWKDLKLTDEDLRDLQNQILRGEGWIPIGGEAYKIRFSPKGMNKGKDTAYRVIFVEIVSTEIIYLASAYSKSDQSNVSSKEKEELKSLSDVLRGERS